MNTLEVIYKYLDALDGNEDAINWFNTLPETKTPLEWQHGKVINYRFEAYHDIKVYEDGYEEWIYIGD